MGPEILTRTSSNKYGADFLVGAKCKIYTTGGETFTVEPLFGQTGNDALYIEDRSKEAGIVIGFVKIDPNEKKFLLAIGEKTPERDFIIMKAIVFPYINVLWLGAILMGFGTFVAFLRRLKQTKDLK